MLVLWYFKLSFEIKELDALHASTENPEFGSGRVDGLFYETSAMHFVKNLCATHSIMVAFMARDIISLNDIFSICPLAGLIKHMVYLVICH